MSTGFAVVKTAFSISSTSSSTCSMTVTYSSTIRSAIACITAAGPMASCSGSASSRARTPVSWECEPCRTVTMKFSPRNSMISPFSTICTRVRVGLMVDVADGLEHQEQRTGVAVELGPLVGVHRVLDGQFVQTEELRNVGHLVGVRLVQADPDESAALARGPSPGPARVVAAGDADAVDIRGAVDDHVARHDGQGQLHRPARHGRHERGQGRQGRQDCHGRPPSSADRAPVRICTGQATRGC